MGANNGFLKGSIGFTVFGIRWQDIANTCVCVVDAKHGLKKMRLANWNWPREFTNESEVM